MEEITEDMADHLFGRKSNFSPAEEWFINEITASFSYSVTRKTGSIRRSATIDKAVLERSVFAPHRNKEDMLKQIAINIWAEEDKSSLISSSAPDLNATYTGDNIFVNIAYEERMMKQKEARERADAKRAQVKAEQDAAIVLKEQERLADEKRKAFYSSNTQYGAF